MISAKSSQPEDAPCGEGQQGKAVGRAVWFSRISAACILNLMLYNIETVSHFSFCLMEQYVFPWNVLQQVTFWVKVGLVGVYEKE